MRLRLLWPDGVDYAVLIVDDGGERVEVRGHRMIGTKVVGDRLDRVMKAFPKTVNVSALFSDDLVDVRKTDAPAIRAALRIEDEIGETFAPLARNCEGLGS